MHISYLLAAISRREGANLSLTESFQVANSYIAASNIRLPQNDGFAASFAVALHDV